MRLDADISAHLAYVEGTLVSGSRVGKGPSSYNITYRYSAPDGQALRRTAIVLANRLDQLGLTDHDAKFLFSHSRQWTVEFDSRDPTVSRLRGFPYNGGSSVATLCGGEALGVFIGLFGFLFLGGGKILAMLLGKMRNAGGG